MDNLLDFINSQHHSVDQLDQVLKTYQTSLKVNLLLDKSMPTSPVMLHMLNKLGIILLLIGEQMEA